MSILAGMGKGDTGTQVNAFSLSDAYVKDIGSTPLISPPAPMLGGTGGAPVVTSSPTKLWDTETTNITNKGSSIALIVGSLTVVFGIVIYFVTKKGGAKKR